MAGMTLIIGGARSGKSSFALKSALALPEKRAFLATAAAIDAEMADRIEKHKQERAGGFVVIEEPYELSRAALGLKNDPAVNCLVVDCLTVWMGNLFHAFSGDIGRVGRKTDEFLLVISGCSFSSILVANEVGLGIVPDNALGRNFRDAAGRLNKEIAAMADEVYLCVCGIPMKIK